MGIHDGHRQRLKEDFLDHGVSFHDHQLLELLLYYAIPQGDVNELAHTLIEEFGSLAGVFDALPEALQGLKGVGTHTAVLLSLIPKLSGRYTCIRGQLGTILLNSRAAYNYLSAYFAQGPRNEMVYLLCLDTKRKVLGCHKIAEGSVNSADFSPRRVVELALALNASLIILAHNHTSGIALPSTEDLIATHQLYDILQDVGIELVDHLILVDGDMVSLKDSGAFAGYHRGN